VCCVTHLAHLVSALRYTFGTPLQCVALHIWHTSSTDDGIEADVKVDFAIVLQRMKG
jgi:hypothetical protein